MSKSKAVSATHTTTTTPNPNPEKAPISIRQICLQGFVAGIPRNEIAKRIQEIHPDSAAAKKSAKHIAWHYGDMKKSGVLQKAIDTAAE